MKNIIEPIIIITVLCGLLFSVTNRIQGRLTKCEQALNYDLDLEYNLQQRIKNLEDIHKLN